MNEQGKPQKFDPKKTTQVVPSPWTEPFQHTHDNNSTPTLAQNGDQSRTASVPAEQRDHMDPCTRDALSTIFNGQ
jgi:hypothetical protein